MDLLERLPTDWREAMAPHLDPDVVSSLGEFVGAEYARHVVYPPWDDLFRAFRLCPLDRARVLILGQDPYHGEGQAHGLCFSVPPGVPIPPSLRNIFRELVDDLGCPAPVDGDLTRWAAQGVLLLNAVLTVRAGAAASHAGHGWEHLTDAAIRALDAKPSRVVFVLWGGYARKKAALVSGPQHVVLEAGHPSPMNVGRFRGCRHFGAVNAALREAGLAEIAWAAPTTP